MEDGELRIIMAGHDTACSEAVDQRYVYFAVHFVRRGRIRLRHGRRGAWTEHAGPVAWTAWPGLELAWGSAAPRDHYRTAVLGALPAAWHEQGLLPRQPVAVADPAAAEWLWNRYVACCASEDAGERRRAGHALEGFLLDLRAGSTAPDATSPEARLRRVLDGLPRNRPDYATQARRAGISLAGLRRRFLAAYGCSPHQYLLSRRCARARELLRNSDASLATIADALGYRDEFYFSRQFRRLSGLAPGAWRRSLRG